MRRESQGKHVFAVVPQHPMADNRGRVLEHRYIMAQHIGRILDDNEVVHHKNGDKKDNKLENLELIKWEEHSCQHNPIKIAHLVCACCGREFDRSARNVRSERSFCSRSCSSSYHVSRRPPKKRDHGTYSFYRYGCRCSDCRAANAKRNREYRRRKCGV